jgi:enamine deaminase RidA (YjgF/YER057c/UK114 family)
MIFPLLQMVSLVKAFGEKGKHTRTTIGVACLPSNAAVEVEAIFSLI